MENTATNLQDPAKNQDQNLPEVPDQEPIEQKEPEKKSKSSKKKDPEGRNCGSNRHSK